MRFFAHDGKSTHGPAGIEELLKLPGFDGDTLVCPVGSDDSSDWKPALAYPPFKKALLDASAPAPKPVLSEPKLPPMPAILPMAPSAPASPFDPPKADALPVPAPFPLSMPVAPALPPMPALPATSAPLPAAAPATKPCPRCNHANLLEARFCNSCGAHMDGRLEDLSPAPAFSPAPSESAYTPPPEPSSSGFEHLDPMLSFPAEPAPMSAPETPRRPLQPGKMGQLAALEEPTPAEPSLSPALAPEPATADAVPVWKRPAVLAAFIGSAALAAGLGYMMLNNSAPSTTVAELSPMAEEAPKGPAMPAAPTLPPPPIYSAPPQTSSPAMPAPRAPRAKRTAAVAPPLRAQTAAAPKPKRARKPRKPRAAPEPAPEAQTSVAEPGGGDTFIESRATDPEPAPKPKGKRAAKAAKAAKAAQAKANQDGKDPLLEALLSDATQSGEPPAEPAEPGAADPLSSPGEKAPPMIGQRPAAKPGQFSLPGLERKVSASDRAAAPQARAPKPAAGEEPSAPPALAEPGKTPPPPGIEDEPAKAADGDQVALVQVHEQFDFCTQLLAQGAFGDHYDTCLCKDAREAAPYRGRRGFYVSSKKKEAGGGRLESTAKILSSKLDNGVATIKARWKAGANDKGRDASQTWKLEDGLWCQAP